MKNIFYLTENEKIDILNQHKNYVNEQGVEVPGLSSKNSILNTTLTKQQVPTQTTPQQTTPQQTTPPPSQGKVESIQPGVFNQKVLDLQKKINEKFKLGLNPDGKWGPKTSSAILNVIKKINQSGTNQSQVNTTSGTNQQQVNTTSGTNQQQVNTTQGDNQPKVSNNPINPNSDSFDAIKSS